MKTLLASLILLPTLFISCNQSSEIELEPDISSLQDGLRISAAVGYGVTLATKAFSGETLPENANFELLQSESFDQAGVLTIQVGDEAPMLFNQQIQDITIVGVWEDGQGLMSMIFSDINLEQGDVRFIGLYTVPVVLDGGKVRTVFAEQDVVVGAGSDTLLQVSFTKPWFLDEIERLEEDPPEDAFAAVKQNVWFVNAQNFEIFNETIYEVNGGGQIAQSSQTSSSVVYHALINTKYSFSTCNINPYDGAGFIQNVEAGTIIDLGNLWLDFNEQCDGTARVRTATGKFSGSFGQDIVLGLN